MLLDSLILFKISNIENSQSLIGKGLQVIVLYSLCLSPKYKNILICAGVLEDMRIGELYDSNPLLARKI